ncbi:MAG: hypothetical protein JSU92_04625 [Deltaproteobacteria bacterium]|nr:MAG: hypothetical protein JSU92_04625 [Deltaproteobacteria bacterium]
MDEKWRQRALSAAVILMLCGVGLFFASCGNGDGDDGGDIACYYEGRHTGCNNSVWTDWEEGCADFPEWNYDSPAQACRDAYPSYDYYCEAGCCIDVEYRNVDPVSGSCY